MNFKKSKKLLKKISKIIDVLEENGEKPSSIENDLMRSYIRELYETITDSDAPLMVQEKTPVQNIVNPIATPIATPSPAQHIEKMNVDPIPTHIPVVPKEPQPQASDSKEDGILEDLFSENDGNDLSDRLSMRPLADIAMGMGINEKIFTIQELFGGNKKGFDETISTLNGFASFEEASEYLKQGVAKSNDWTTEGKLKKASNFLKLVRRRYR